MQSLKIRKGEVILKIIKGIFSIILSVILICSIGTKVASSTILSKNYVIGKFKETNYYMNTYSQALLDLENYIYQSGLDENIMKDLISIEDIEKDTNLILSNIYEGSNEEIDTSKITEKLKANINASLEGKKLSTQAEDSINMFINQIEEQYKDSVLHTDFESKINNGYTKVYQFINSAEKYLAIAIIVLLILMFALQHKEWLKNIKYVGISLCSCGSFYIFLNMFIWAKIKIENITILSNAMTYSLRYILKDILNTINLYGLAFFAIGVIVIFMSNSLQNKKEEK